MKRIISVVLAAVMLCSCALMLTGCGRDGKNFPVTVAGVTIESRPKSVVCLSPRYTEILANIGYTSLLVGRPYDCMHSDVQNIPSIGTSDSPAVDLIVGLEPDLVIADTSTPTELLTQIANSGIQILQLLPPTTRTAFSNLYRCLGSAVDGATDGYIVGDSAAKALLIKMDDVERAVSLENSLNVVVFTDDNLTKGITGDSLGSLAIELAGGFNLAIEGVNGNVDFDVIATSDPDVIICPSGTEGTVRSMRALQSCSAIQNNTVYCYDAYKLESLGPDLVSATWELARLIHPSIVTAAMMPEGAVDFLPDPSDLVLEDGEIEEYIAAHSEDDKDDELGYEDLFADGGNADQTPAQ